MGKRTMGSKAMTFDGNPGRNKAGNRKATTIASSGATSEQHTLSSVPNTGPGIVEVNAELARQARGTRKARKTPLFR